MPADTSLTTTKARVMILISIVCGSTAGLLLWRSFSKPPAPDEDLARKIGFRTSSEMQEYDKAQERMVNDQYKQAGLDEQDFAYVQRVLTANNKQTIQTLVNLKDVSLPGQQHRILQILGANRVPATTRPAWLMLFKNWSMQKQHGKEVIPFLLTSSNRDVVELANEAKTESAR